MATINDRETHDLCNRCMKYSMPKWKVSKKGEIGELATARACQNPGCRAIEERVVDKVVDKAKVIEQS